MKIFNTLSALTAELVNNKKHFISMQKRLLIAEFFYSINEYLNYQHEVKINDSPITKALSTLYILRCFDTGLVIILYNHVL